ncbi:hypothetical protein V6N13_083720 [Hibiscus sabdariffa]
MESKSKQTGQCDTPNNPKVITIKMPRLQAVFVVLKDNFKKIVERNRHNGGSYGCGTTRGKALDGIHGENSRNVKIISKLRRGAAGRGPEIGVSEFA